MSTEDTGHICDIGKLSALIVQISVTAVHSYETFVFDVCYLVCIASACVSDFQEFYIFIGSKFGRTELNIKPIVSIEPVQTCIDEPYNVV